MTNESKEVFTWNMSGKNEAYLKKIFSILKEKDGLLLTDKKAAFNSTELRLLSEVITAGYEGKRLISTRIATKLGVTRSAVSQIVNRLEERNIVKRVPDDVDKKIAYIELSEGILELYGEELKEALDFIGSLVDDFGEENFNLMYELFDRFIKLARQKMQEKETGK